MPRAKRREAAEEKAEEKGVTTLAKLDPEAVAAPKAEEKPAEPKQSRPEDSAAAPFHIATSDNIEESAAFDPNYEGEVALQGFDMRNPQPPPRPTRDKKDPVPKEQRDGYIYVATEFMGETKKFKITLPNLWGTLPFKQRKPDELFRRLFSAAKTFFPRAKAEIIE